MNTQKNQLIKGNEWMNGQQIALHLLKYSNILRKKIYKNKICLHLMWLFYLSS